MTEKGTGDGGGKSNWALVLSLVSPLVMAIGLISQGSIYKERVDIVTSVVNPEFLVEYGKLQQRVTELEEEIVFLQDLLKEDLTAKSK